MTLQSFVAVFGPFPLEFQDLSIQLVDQRVDRRVQVTIGAFCKEVLAPDVQGDLGLLDQLVHGQEHVDVDHVIVVPFDPLELGRDVLTQCRCDADMMSADREVHASSFATGDMPRDDWRLGRCRCDTGCRRRSAHSVLRWDTGGIRRDSRYLATERRATTMPCSPSVSAIWLSDKGCLESSAAMSCLIRARIAVLEAAPPLSVATWLPKKYLSSKVPCGVSMYFCVVTRETVDSWSPRVSAISRRTSGRIATSPCEKNAFCRSTMACETRRMVSNRCWTFLINQRASCNCAAKLAWAPRWRLRMLA